MALERPAKCCQKAFIGAPQFISPVELVFGGSLDALHFKANEEFVVGDVVRSACSVDNLITLFPD